MTNGFLRGAGLLALMAEEIAERRKLATVTAMIPALRFLRSFENDWLRV
jgi:hypothetical protein